MFRLTIAVVLGAGVLTACGGTTARSEATVDWQPCSENAEFDCATVPVPIDWSNPDGEMIGIAVVRDAAGDPANRVGTLISLPGGPGTSGVDEILKGEKFSPELRERFDIVSLDPRGVKRSHEVLCDAGLAAGRPNMVPDNGGRIDEVHAYARDFADSCREYTGPLMDHLGTGSVVRDVEAIRSALGEEQISLYGRSYGTMPGQAYAELFPQRVRALLLDSVDDHSLDGTGFLATSARAAEDNFGEFVSWCEQDERCALRGKDIRQAYGDLYERAERGELRQPDKPSEPLTDMELNMAVIQPLYGPEWPRLADELRTLMDQPPALPSTQAMPERLGKPAPTPEMAVCADWRFDIPDQDRWAQLWREQRQNAPTMRTHFAWTAGSICSGWPGGSSYPHHRPQVDDGPPILVMNSRHDPATPLEWAAAVTEQTSGATLLTYEGWGHGVYRRTTCTTHAGDRYLIDRIVPPPNTQCAAE